MQYQAGYILESVRNQLKSYAQLNNKEAALHGLLLGLSTFNVSSPQINIETPSNIPSILAVALNILTRGLPTFASILVENYFSKTLQLTTQIKDEERGRISFPFNNQHNFEAYNNQLYSALHVIDSRAKNRLDYLDVENVDSNFERDFLLKLIPESYNYFAQLLEGQRSRSSFTRDNNKGRVDFSLEIPYNYLRKDISRFRQSVELKHHKIFIVEVDGKRYHSDLLDDLKDFEVAQLSTNVRHIKEDSVHKNVTDFINSIAEEEFIKIIANNFEDKNYLTDPITALALSPFGIARLQRIFLHYLIANYDALNLKSIIKIAVVERDLPCAHAAFEDIHNLLNTLNELAQTQINLSVIEIEVYVSPEFINHPLHFGKQVKRMVDIIPEQFDVILDISLLHKEGIFKEDKQLASNTITIRNAHYIHYQTSTGVFSAPPLTYRPLVNQLQNEIFEPIEDTTALLTQLLQDVFRKLNFRDGQLPILNRAIQLKSVIGLLPTGGGKSLTYQLAAMLQPGITIVIDPIRSLMIDQYNGLQEMGIDKCEFINSTLSTAERNFNQHHLLAKGKLQFLFVSPERFVIDDFRMALDNAAKDFHYVAYAVIDEVHCVSEWGHDFRTPYLNLGDNAQEFCHAYNNKKVPLFGLTATASFDVLADIERELNIEGNDGNAVIRFENSVRDEVNYVIQEVPNVFENLGNLTERSIKEIISKKKQEAIFDLISNKENILKRFNNAPAINSIIEDSLNNYVSIGTRQKIYNAENASNNLEAYTSKLHDKLRLKDNSFEINTLNEKQNYQYGIIVFMPHRQGWLGVRNGIGSHGVFDNPDYVEITNSENEITHHCSAETLGYFMGSGDDDNSDKVDEESFHHLGKFKEDEESIMIATKAFGMGIDKPNVRMTIHINIPSSIESFVQEAGRGGRDGKLSASVILFNNNLLQLMSRPKELYHLDKDILMYFHKGSFKGQVKERVMIHEIRTKITFPNTSNLQMLIGKMNDLYGNDNIQFNIKQGNGIHTNRIFINTLSEISIGYVYLDTQVTGVFHNLGDDTFCRKLVEFLKNNIPFNTLIGIGPITGWLKQVVVSSNHSIGLENMLSQMLEGETKEIVVPFTNHYYSKAARSKNFFILNREHLIKVISTNAVKDLIKNGLFSENSFSNFFANAVYAGMDYLEFIESLHITNEPILKQLLNVNDPSSLDLQKAYYISRNQSDTAKAIYRLVSIGIIDNYTIDYQNKLYKISFTKNEKGFYFNSLESLISRYTSKNVARREIDNLKEEAFKEIKVGKATEMSKCLEFLTQFIYDKIKAKRLQAIEDMVNLCTNSLKITNHLEQNKFIKDEIYYYFNAKYSRVGFKEVWSNRNINGLLEEHTIEASLPDDLSDDLAINETIIKYIKLVENDDTGEFMSNIKHLRGSTMKMLRAYPDMPQYRILKSFTLFILGDIVKELITDAKEEFVKGLIDWKQNEGDKFNVEEFIIKFKNSIKKHLNNEIETAFNDIEDRYYTLYFTTWTRKFKTQFLAKS